MKNMHSKMNNSMKTRHLILCALVTLMSCGPRNTPDRPLNPDPEPDNSPKAAKIQYAFATNDEMVDLFYIKISYLDGSGSMQSVTLSEPAWAVSAQSASLPAVFAMHVDITMRGMADVTKYDVVPVNYGWSYVATATNSEGLSVGEVYRNAKDVELDVAPNKVSTWVETYQSHPIDIHVEFDKDGKIVK